MEQAVYAKKKGIDYSYATDGDNPYLHTLGGDVKAKGKDALKDAAQVSSNFSRNILMKVTQPFFQSIDQQWDNIVAEYGPPPEPKVEKKKLPAKNNPLNLLDDFDDNASVATTATDTKSVIGTI